METEPAVSLLRYTERLFDTLEARLRDRDAALESRLAAMNEIREAMKDQAAKMATRDQLDGVKEAVALMKVHIAVTSAIVSLLVSAAVTVIVRLLTR